MNNSLDSYTKFLVDLFSKLALEGHGSLSRGKYFFALHLLEFVRNNNLTNYGPRNKPHLWLKLLFDLVGDYFHGYTKIIEESGGSKSEAEQEVKGIIQKELEQTWQSFIIKLRKVGKENNWNNIATMMDNAIKGQLKNKKGKLEQDSLSLYLGTNNLANLDVDAMRVIDVFYWLPKLINKDKKDQPKHEMASTLVKKIKEILSEPWNETVKERLENIKSTLEESKELGEHQNIPLLVNIFSCLPPSGIDLLNVITDFLLRHDKFPRGYEFPKESKESSKNYEPYSFIVFYILASNSLSKNIGRCWQSPSDYCSELDKVNFEELFNHSRGIRIFELALLGASTMFCETFEELDRLLEDSDLFPQLHGDQPWYEIAEKHLDEIENAMYSLWQSVIRKINEKGNN